jgi:hypothetical protein
MLSVASPLCKLDLNFDVRFQYIENDELSVLVSKKKQNLIDPRLLSMFVRSTRILNTDYLVIDASKVLPDFKTLGLSLIKLKTAAAQAAAYPVIMGNVTEILYRIFPGIGVVVCEQSKRIPWALPLKQDVELVQ